MLRRPAVTFTRSHFGGGWLVPHGGKAARLIRQLMGHKEYALAPMGGARGWLIEPYEAEDLFSAIAGTCLAMEVE